MTTSSAPRPDACSSLVSLASMQPLGRKARRLAALSVLAGLLALPGIASADDPAGEPHRDGFDRPLGQGPGNQAERREGRDGRRTSNVTITQTEVRNGKRYTLTMRDGELTAQIDGRDVPEDRYRVQGDKVEFLTDEGEVEFSMSKPGANMIDGPGMNMPDVDRMLREMGVPGLRMGRPGEGFNFGWNQQAPPRVMIGVVLREPLGNAQAQPGAVVESVREDGPAAKAGIRAGDRLIFLDGKAIEDPAGLRALLRDHQPGDKVDIKFERDGKEQVLTVELAAFEGDAGPWMNPPEGWDRQGPGVWNFDLNDGQRMMLVDPQGLGEAQRQALREAEQHLREALKMLQDKQGDLAEQRNSLTTQLERVLTDLRRAQEQRQGQFQQRRMFIAPGAGPRGDDDEVRRLREELRDLRDELRDLRRDLRDRDNRR